jgi:hypothetical protein
MIKLWEKCSLQEMACPKNSEWLVLRAGLSSHHSRACPNSEWLVLTAGLSYTALLLINLVTRSFLALKITAEISQIATLQAKAV